MTDATTLLFGLPGLRVITVTQELDGTRIVDAATDDPAAAACPDCGLVSTSRKENTVTTPQDIPYGVDRIILRWNKSRWRCLTADCERNTFTEVIGQVPARARTTDRLRQQIGSAIGRPPVRSPMSPPPILCPDRQRTVPLSPTPACS